MVGRLGRAVLKLYNKENAEAMTDLTPMPRQLGALGLFKGVEAVAKSLTKTDAKVKKVPYSSMLLSQSQVHESPLTLALCQVGLQVCCIETGVLSHHGTLPLHSVGYDMCFD